MIGIRTDVVQYELAAPASKMDVIKWLLTGGRKGKLFVRNLESFKRYHVSDNPNCRCVMPKIDIK